MRYEIKDLRTGKILGSHRSRSVAEDSAHIRKYSEGIDVVVIAHERSGTYESFQQVWPTRGEIYTN